jgi:hypothetical protein
MGPAIRIDHQLQSARGVEAEDPSWLDHQAGQPAASSSGFTGSGRSGALPVLRGGGPVVARATT